MLNNGTLSIEGVKCNRKNVFVRHHETLTVLLSNRLRLIEGRMMMAERILLLQSCSPTTATGLDLARKSAACAQARHRPLLSAALGSVDVVLMHQHHQPGDEYWAHPSCSLSTGMPLCTSSLPRVPKSRHIQGTAPITAASEDV